MLKSERNKIHSDKFTLGILETKDHFCCPELQCFDCGDGDLNDFFINDAFAHKKALFAETYYFQPKEVTDKSIFYPVALVSFSNDSIKITKEERKGDLKRVWKSLTKKVPFEKRTYQSFPAVKIGRLAVKKEYQNQDIGTSLLNMSKELFITRNRTGCRFVTVDAYNKPRTIEFYKKNGFGFLWEKDKDEDNRIMFFDLIRYKEDISS